MRIVIDLSWLPTIAVFRIHGLGPRFVWAVTVLDGMNCNTRKAYVGALRRLQEWLGGRRLTDEVLAEYLRHLAKIGRGASSLEQMVSAVGRYAKEHRLESPVGPRTVAALRRLRCLTVDRGRGQAPAATPEEVHAMVETAETPRTRADGRVESQDCARRRGLVDVALVAVLFMGALRVSEAAALRWTDVVETDDGTGAYIWVRRSKTNPYGANADVRFVKGVLAEALLRLRVADGAGEIGTGEVGAGEKGDGLVFGGLTAATLSRRITALAKAAGIRKRLTGHSLRVGLAVELTRLGASMQEVMHAGAWKSAAMVARYSAAARAEGGAVAKYL